MLWLPKCNISTVFVFMLYGRLSIDAHLKGGKKTVSKKLLCALSFLVWTGFFFLRTVEDKSNKHWFQWALVSDIPSAFLSHFQPPSLSPYRKISFLIFPSFLEIALFPHNVG